MAITDLYSRRKARERGDFPDVFQYKDIPPKLRIQLVHILTEALGPALISDRKENPRYKAVFDVMCREHGWKCLLENTGNPTSKLYCHGQFTAFLEHSPHLEYVLDVVEQSLQILDLTYEEANRVRALLGHPPLEDVAVEVNQRFLDSGVGFQYRSGQMIEVRTEFEHKEIVLPALVLLSGERFSGANDEFMIAHEHYRKGRHKECLTECAKAFESVMKIICDAKSWPIGKKGNASDLVNACLENGLLPSYTESQLTGIRTLLQSAVPTPRNKAGAHGQGEQIREVSAASARFALHSTAANILYLIESANL